MGIVGGLQGVGELNKTLAAYRKQEVILVFEIEVDGSGGIADILGNLAQAKAFVALAVKHFCSGLEDSLARLLTRTFPPLSTFLLDAGLAGLGDFTHRFNLLYGVIFVNSVFGCVSSPHPLINF